MKQDKKFLRQCICCREFNEKESLIRITRDFKTKEAKINQFAEIQGRSVYICKKEECVEKALKKKKIEHFLSVNLSDSFKQELKAVLKN